MYEERDKELQHGLYDSLRSAVAIRFRNRVTIRSAVLAIIGAIGRVPGLVVHGAVETLWYIILGKNIGIKKYLEAISYRKYSM